MIPSLSSKRIWAITCFLCELMLISCVYGQGQRSPSKKDDANRWKTLENAGKQYLAQASECFQLYGGEKRCDQGEYLSKAAGVYNQMAAQLIRGSIDSERLLTVADGLIKSGHVYDAVKVLQQNDTRDDPSLIHIMGDALYSIGDYRSAAKAYRRWVELGCKGYFIDPDDTSLWAVQKDLPRCSTLPALLRTRLDYIEDRLPDEDSGFKLPKVNVPAVRSTAQ
jgi:hypothetical protein